MYLRNNYPAILSEIDREGFAAEETVNPSRFFVRTERRNNEMSAKRSAIKFLLLSAVMFLFMLASYGSLSHFQIGSEGYVSGMIAAGVLDMDLSDHDFGLNIISCDGIVWSGDRKYVEDEIYHDTLYLVWNSPKYIGHDSSIVATREQQLGIQGWPAYYLGRTYKFLHVPPKYYYHLFRMFNIFILVMVLTGITLQLMKAYDAVFSACFYFICITSSWIAGFSVNLYWVEFLWFIPMLLGLICMNHPEKRFWMYPLIFISVAIKSMCGYEYISTVMMLPEVFIFSEYIASRGKNTQRANLMFKITVGVGICALAGFAATLIFHSYIRGGGDILSGLNEIYRADALRITSGSAADFPMVFKDSLNASVLQVLAKYFFSKPDGWLSSGLIILTIATILSARKKHSASLKRDVSLLILSFLCSISWLVLAKGHSYNHPHINFVLLYMPFVPTALYIFLKYRVMTLIPDSEKRRAFFDSACSFVRRVFWLS